MRAGMPMLCVLCASVFLSCTDNDERYGGSAEWRHGVQSEESGQLHIPQRLYSGYCLGHCGDSRFLIS
jgi:hypothetical protein